MSAARRRGEWTSTHSPPISTEKRGSKSVLRLVIPSGREKGLDRAGLMTTSGRSPSIRTAAQLTIERPRARRGARPLSPSRSPWTSSNTFNSTSSTSISATVDHRLARGRSKRGRALGFDPRSDTKRVGWTEAGKCGRARRRLVKALLTERSLEAPSHTAPRMGSVYRPSQSRWELVGSAVQRLPNLEDDDSRTKDHWWDDGHRSHDLRRWSEDRSP
jgi:hypothetical protein